MRILPAVEDGAGTPPGDRIAKTVGHHLAMQAQDLASGLWSVGVRTGATRAQVETAVADRLVTRSWPMRGTL
ncbi:MAG: crosslink repair DNA glycosylase YcaQ family protein, partial [Lapillicoccus sp.]